MSKKTLIVLLTLLLMTTSSGTAKEVVKEEVVKESVEQRDARMEWWRDARFGMFVHWGLYSGLAGTWEGKPVAKTGGMEWIQQRVEADTETYAQRAIPLFRPTENFASKWAKLAKAAGCRYLVFTTKHHDGFALHDSKVSDFDAGSVLNRDLVREIVTACRNEGLRVGFYHSVIDWHHDQYDYAQSKQSPHPLINSPYPDGQRDHSKYIDYLHAEANELVSNYGQVDIMWWDYTTVDFPGEKAWRAFELIDMVRKKQPAIIMNNRLFRTPEAGWKSMGVDGFVMKLDPKYGDFITPEQHVPEEGMPGIDWETCMTLNTTWGYSEHDHAWKSDQVLIRHLIDIASKGGNFLLNIGPKGDGSVPAPSVKSLQAIGKWMAINRESIHGTTQSSIGQPEWGRCTQTNDKLYLHIFDWPKDSELTLSAEGIDVKQAYLLADKTKTQLNNERQGEEIVIHLPELCPDPIATVVVVELNQ